MELWGWIIAYILGFALLQLFLYRYFMQENSTADSSADGATPRFEGASSSVDHSDRTEVDSPGTDVASCEQCGGRNDAEAVYTYCKHCGSRL